MLKTFKFTIIQFVSRSIFFKLTYLYNFSDFFVFMYSHVFYKNKLYKRISLQDLGACIEHTEAFYAVDFRLFEPALIRIIRLFELRSHSPWICLPNSVKNTHDYSNSSYSNFQLFEPIFIKYILG